MNQSFIETNENLLINFTQIFTCKKDVEIGINENLKNLESKERYWLKFWCDQGEQIVLNKWYKKYQDYICEGKEENNKERTVEYHSDVELYTELWSRIWYQHQQEIYVELFHIFGKIFQQYCLDLKNSFEPIHDGDELSDNESFLLEDFVKLQLYGLPVCFGPKGRTMQYIMESTFNEGELSIESPSDLEKHSDEMNAKTTVKPLCEKDLLSTIQTATTMKSSKGRKKKKLMNRKLRNVPKFMLEEKGLLKYWRKRFSLFSRFDEGIRLDRESWFSVTPEKVAKHLAKRLSCDIIIDGFCGCGGNAIQFAFFCQKVIAIDIDMEKLEMAKHNAKIYGVAHKIDFILGDYLVLATSGLLIADIVFLSPPWGGPQYKKRKSYNIEKSLLPVSATELLNKTRNITKNIAIFLPRNSNMPQIIKLAGPGNRCEIEHSYLDEHLIGITALYGNAIVQEVKALKVK